MSGIRFRSSAARCLLVALASVANGCAGATTGEGTAAAPARRTNLLTAGEMEAKGVADRSLAEAIRNLRPGFLVVRTGGERAGGVEPIRVSLNGANPGGLYVLEDLRANNVASVMRLTPEEALQRFGMRDVIGPVLLVTLK